MRKPLPPQELLQRIFRYDAETGVLYWRERADARPQWNGIYAGTVAGNINPQNRVIVSLKGYRLLKAHRIIWKMVFGDEPEEIDHVDCDPSNNRINNLRPATRKQNARNVRGRAASGYKGVSFHKMSGLWRARLRRGDGRESCTYHATPELAHAAYCEMAERQLGEFARFA